MRCQRTQCPLRHEHRQDAARRWRARAPGLWLALSLGVALALQACTGLTTDSGQYRTVPGTGGGASALSINTSSHFQGHIAFVRNHRLYVLNGKDSTVTALPAGTNVQDPAYSPDGSRLAYIRRSASWSDLMVIPARGGQPVALTHNQGTGQEITCANGVSEADTVWAANPVWTPDGSALYYLSDAQKLEKASCGFQDLAIWKIPAQGGKATLTLWPARGDDNTGLPGAGGDANVSLRPGSGNELTYTHYAYNPDQDGSRWVQVFLASLDQPQEPAPGQPPTSTANQQQEETALTPATADDGTPQQALEASWSPDGRWLAYIIRAKGIVSLAVMRVGNPARGAPNFLDYLNSTPLLYDSRVSYSYPVWSPDGKSLLFLEFSNNEYNLYLEQLSFSGSSISLQGSPIQLTQGGVDGDSHPSWTAA